MYLSDLNNKNTKRLLFYLSILVFLVPTYSASAAKLLSNPREVNVQKLIRGQATTLVTATNVNVRNLPTTTGNGGFIFATLSKGDKVYVIGCEGFSEGYYWLRIYIPDLKEFGYVSAQFLQNNYNNICR